MWRISFLPEILNVHADFDTVAKPGKPNADQTGGNQEHQANDAI